MMDIQFKEEEALYQEMQEAFNGIPDAIYLDHYELSKQTKYSSLKWKSFLTHPAVSDWFQSELRLMVDSKLRILIRDIDGNTKSTGLPQLINTLTAKSKEDSKKSSGPIFVVLHIPLNEQEQNAPNVRKYKSGLELKDLTEI